MKKKSILVILAVVIIVIATLTIFFSGIQRGFTKINPENKSTITLLSGGFRAPTLIEIPASEYQQMLNSGLFVQVHCFDGRVGIERAMVRPFREPCFVSK